MRTLVIGGSGFVGSYLLDEIEADNLDLKAGEDVRHGIDGKYKTIVFLACNQANAQTAYKENSEMYKALDNYRQQYPKTYLIYVSSAAVYTPNSIYAQSKRLGEAYANKFKHHAILRLSNVYGHGDGHGAPDRFQRGEKTIHGNGEQIRDLIPVEKVAHYIADCIKQPRYGVFNVSSGRGTTVNEMFKLFGEGKPKYNKTHPYGVEYSILEPGRVHD